MAIAYVEHPVSKADADKIKSQGYKINDLRFAPANLPDGDKIVTKQKPKPKPKPSAKAE